MRSIHLRHTHLQGTASAWPRALSLAVTAVLWAAAIPAPAAPGESSGPAAPPAGITAPDRPLLNGLQPGATGYGVTVLRGWDLDTFAVEILGVQSDALAPGVDLILGRLSGAGLEETGVVRGMSGSPVYIDGRLVGAVAYGWAFSRVPICGITPIGAMLSLTEGDLAPPTSESEAAAGPRPGADDPRRATDGRAGLQPLASPVWVAGAAGAAAGVFEEVLEPFGLQVVAGPAGSGTERLPGPRRPGRLRPGDAVGAQLVRGDLSVTAIGTATHVDGDRLMAFGHPMLGLGRVDVPLTGAHIHGVMPSQLASFKLGEATEVVGALRRDRLPGVGALLGAAARLVPVAVTVGQQDFAFEVLPHRLLAPGLVRGALLASLEARERLVGDATLELTTAVELSDGRRLEGHQVFAGPDALFAASLAAAEPVAALTSAPFQGLDLASLSYDVQVRDALEAAELAGLRLGRTHYVPGDTVAVTVDLQPHRRPRQQVRVHLVLPAGLPPGAVEVRAGSALQALEWERERWPDGFEPRSGAELLRLLARPGRRDDVVVELSRPEESLSLDGRELPGLPPSARAILANGPGAGRLGHIRGRIVARAARRTAYALSGELTTSIDVAAP